MVTGRPKMGDFRDAEPRATRNRGTVASWTNPQVDESAIGAEPDWARGRLVDNIAELLRERIIHGRYPAGARLTQRVLADDLSVSRSVVAEALRILEREGFVATAPGGRAILVAPDDRATLLSAYLLREMIDGLAARLAAARGTAAVDRMLRASVREQRAAVAVDDVRRYRRANLGFHVVLIEAAGNPLLLGQVPLVRATSRSAVAVGPGRRRAAVAEHDAIAGAVRARQPDEAEAAARAHVRATLALLEEL
jgi:DNA-binding GntR family transcriptional regulator